MGRNWKWNEHQKQAQQDQDDQQEEEEEMEQLVLNQEECFPWLATNYQRSDSQWRGPANIKRRGTRGHCNCY